MADRGTRLGIPPALARLWTPSITLANPSQRRRTRVTLILLLTLLALGLVDLVVSASGAYGKLGHDFVIETFGVLGILLAYALVRRGFASSGVVLVTIIVQVLIWHFRFDTPSGPGKTALLYFLAVPILLAGLLLPVRAAVAMAALTIASAILGEAYLDARSALNLDIEDFALFFLLFAVAVLSITASALTERDARQLQETTALLKQITDNVPEVMFIVEGDGSRMLYTSPAYETVVGRKVEQSLADPNDWLNAVHPDDLPRVQAGLAAGQPDLEYRVVHPTQGVKHVRARTFPVLAADGKVLRIVGIAEDITATVQAQENLREAQRQRIHLMQQLAHDLASPLTPIKLQLRILQGGASGPGGKGLDIIRRNAEHLERLVADVRDVARMEGGDFRVSRAPVDVADLARQCVESLAASAAERKVRLIAEVATTAPAQADAGRMTQVMYNLIGNALKFTPPDGQVTVAVAMADNGIEVAVRDTGTGMTTEQLSRLFKPFSQVHDPAAIKRPEDKGTGLGLYISKGLVEAHGGSMSAHSEGPGQGSTFTFRLPLA